METKSCSVIEVNYDENGNMSVIDPKENNVINDTLNEPNAEVINADDTKVKPNDDMMAEPDVELTTAEKERLQQIYIKHLQQKLILTTEEKEYLLQMDIKSVQPNDETSYKSIFMDEPMYKSIVMDEAIDDEQQSV